MTKLELFNNLFEDTDNSATNPLQGSLYNYALKKRFAKKHKDEKGALTKAATLLALMSPANKISTADASPIPRSPVAITQTKYHHGDYLDMFPKDMAGIIRAESSNGKNTKHTTVKHGINKGDTAAGFTGLMPITVKETVKKNPNLAKFKYLLDLSNDEITAKLNAHPEIEAEIATAHWNRLGRIFKSDELRKIFAWNQGITGAKNATDDEVANHKYVVKVTAAPTINIAQR